MNWHEVTDFGPSKIIVNMVHYCIATANSTELPTMKIEEVIYEECGGKIIPSQLIAPHCTFNE